MEHNTDDTYTEVERYLSDCSSEFSSLDTYPSIKHLYILLKRGLPLPASAAVERVFSLSGRVFSTLHTMLSPEHFETRMWANAQRDGRPAEHT